MKSFHCAQIDESLAIKRYLAMSLNLKLFKYYLTGGLNLQTSYSHESKYILLRH